MAESFSDRYNFRPDDVEITMREGATPALRDAIVMLAEREMSPSEIRAVVCQVLLVTPDLENWSERPNIANEVYSLVLSCPWYKVYDIAEALYRRFEDEWVSGVAKNYQDGLNREFIERGIGWEMQDGRVVFRGSGTFTPGTKSAVNSLESTGRNSAAQEMKEDVPRHTHKLKADQLFTSSHSNFHHAACDRDKLRVFMTLSFSKSG